jgi:hypothetical protein
MTRRLIAAATLALLAAPVAIAGKLSEESRKQIGELLELVTIHEPLGDIRFGEMKTGEVVSIILQGDATVEYYANAIADDDTANIDLVALEADGTEIDLDDAPDNGPVVHLPAREYRSVLDKPKGIARVMTIEVRMIDCQAETCAYGLMITQVE